MLGMLPRGKKFRQLVSEFEQYIECYIKPGDVTMLNKFLSQCPKGSRATNRRCLTWGQVRVETLNKHYVDVDKDFLEGNVDPERRVKGFNRDTTRPH